MQLLVEELQADIALGAEIFLEIEVRCPGAIGAQRRRASRAGDGAAVGVIAIVQADLHILEAGALDFARARQADDEVAREAQRQVGAGQDIPIGRAARRRHQVGRRQILEAARLLLGILRQHAHIAGQFGRAHRGLDVGHQIGGHHALGDGIGLGGHILAGVGGQHIDAILQQLEGVIGQDRPDADNVQIRGAHPILLGQHQRRRAIGEVQEIFVGRLGLGAIGIAQARRHLGQETAFDLLAELDLIAFQLIIDDAVVIIALLMAERRARAPAQRIGQDHEVRIAIVQLAAGEARAGAGADEIQRVGRAHTGAIAGASIGFERQLAAIGARIAKVETGRPAVVPAIFGVEAAREYLRRAFIAMVVHHRFDIGEGAAVDEIAVARRAAGDQRRAGPVEREFHAALDLLVLEVAVEAIEGQHQRVGRLHLHAALDAQALELGGHAKRLDAANHLLAIGSVGIAPGFELLGLVGLVAIGDRQGDADAVAGKLVDIGAGQAIAHILAVGVDLAQVGIDAACADGDQLLAIIERTDGADVDRADQPLMDEVGLRRLVDIHAADDFGGILVELDIALLAGRRLRPAIERGRGQVGAGAADRDRIGAAEQALRCQAGQASDGFADRRVGQLADILGRDRFDDRLRILLHIDRILQRGAETGDDDRAGRIILRRAFGLGRAVLRHGGRSARRRDDREHGSAQPLGAVEMIGHYILSPCHRRSLSQPARNPLSAALVAV